MTHDNSEAADVKQLGKLITDIRVAMLTTFGQGDGLRSRPMYTQDTTFDGTLWFLTSADAELVGDIEAREDVLLTYAHSRSQSYVSINGAGGVYNDRARIRALWRPSMKAWFPEGEEDPEIRVLRVIVKRAEFWDSPPAPVRLFQFARALATGEQMEGGTHETLRLELE